MITRKHEEEEKEGCRRAVKKMYEVGVWETCNKKLGFKVGNG